MAAVLRMTPTEIGLLFAYRAVILAIRDQQYITPEHVDELVSNEMTPEHCRRLVAGLLACGIITRETAAEFLPENEPEAAIF